MIQLITLYYIYCINIHLYTCMDGICNSVNNLCAAYSLCREELVTTCWNLGGRATLAPLLLCYR